MFPTELFIKCIETKQCLWDIKGEHFGRRDLKEKAWTEIGRIIYKDWVYLNSDEKQMKLTEMKKKWNNIKDYYRRDYLSENNNRSTNSKRKKYIFADLLVFLNPVYEVKVDNFESSNTVPQLSWSKVEEVHKDENESNEGNAMKIRKIKSNAKSNKKKIKKRCKPVQKKILNILKQHQHPSATPNDENPNLSFLKSFVPEMQEMSPYQRMDFKSGMLDLLRLIKYPALEQDEEMDDTVSVDHDVDSKQRVDLSSASLANPPFPMPYEYIVPKTELTDYD